MIVTQQTQAIQTLEQVRAFVAGSEPVSFTIIDRPSARAWMADTLKRFGYAHASRADRGVLRRYLTKATGLSRAQITRRIAQFIAAGGIKDRRGSPAAPFARRYTTNAFACWPWPRSTHCMAHCPAAPRENSASGHSRCTATPVSSGWRRSPAVTCTTCVAPPAIELVAAHSTKPVR